MNDLLAATQAFINLQAAEPMLRDGYRITITRWRSLHTQQAHLYATLEPPVEPSTIDGVHLQSIPIFTDDDFATLMSEKKTIEQLMNEIWANRIPHRAKQATH